MQIDKTNQWPSGDLDALGIGAAALESAINFHDSDARFTQSYGGALLIIYRGQLIGESYVTGVDGGPQPWTAATCNDMKSSTKSVFGTAVGLFLDEFKDRITLDSLLVGDNRNNTLLPQIWDQPLSDERKRRIKVKHALSMTSGHASPEPWLAPSKRSHAGGYSGAMQLYEYCFGWWQFEEVPNHHSLLFEPGSNFNYSNYGLELLALAMRNISGEEIAPYLYKRVLEPSGFPSGIVENHYLHMPYTDEQELNFSAEPGWGRGGSSGGNAYGADGSASPYGYNSIVGSTFRCTARDFARLGQLWLNKGRWGDRQLIPAAWIEEATTRFVQENGTSPANYGYTFWLFDEWDGVPKDTFASLGHNVNDCYVIPSRDLVIVRQGNANHDSAKRTDFVKTVIQKVVAAIPTR